MDAVGRVLCESEHEKGPHKPNSFRKSKRGQICCQRCCLKFMACGSIIFPLATESLSSPPVTFHAFVCCCVVSNEWQVCHERVLWFHAEVSHLLIAMIQEHVFYLRCCHCFNRGTWRLDKDISSLLMWLEYNLLQESTATICLAL
jgi:hypothetical protein